MAATWAGTARTTESARYVPDAVVATQPATCRSEVSPSGARSSRVTGDPVRRRSPRTATRASTIRSIPAAGEWKTGAAGSATAAVRRRPASRPSVDRAGASSWGAMTAQLRSSARPALIPPSSGSTRRSNTRSPTHARMTAPTLRSPLVPRALSRVPPIGTSGTPSPASRSRSAGASSPGATVSGSSGTPRTLGDGMGHRASSNHNEAFRADGETSSVSMPSSTHRSSAHGTRTRNASAPASIGSPSSIGSSRGPVRR